ncbi:Neurochondrin-domain-containing protein [Podospora appendiculata]|uniref:Neurochondrin-domain-containing protein n=1 Tax=Podospora appendiculata TaxID=314037 RepID=A0AAE0X165_9PEZI|nr:Neurochondrin-domain-containing protein [Podospora appendiculata]
MSDSPSKEQQQQQQQQQQQEPGSVAQQIQQIQTLLKAKDDTSRFVGLALLKTVLDNAEDVRNDEGAIVTLWESIPPKFLDRLIKTGSRQQGHATAPGNANDMLDLAVAVLHTFAALLPDQTKNDARVLGRIPQLVACLLHCSNDTARLVLETLLSLVSQPDGARVFNAVEDLTPLTEIAPSQPLVLEALGYAWLSSMAATADKDSLRSKIDDTISSLVSSFKGTDAVTLLDFLAKLLPRLEPELIPSSPKWIAPLVAFVRNLVTSRPTAAGRAAYTNLAAALLEVYLETAPQLLFVDDGKDEKPFAYILISLLLVDLRASLPTLLEQLNSPQYIDAARRLTSAFNVVSNFIGYLLRSMDDDSAVSWPVPPDLLLKIRKSISETMSLAIEYLRDRWDASVAGAMGLHPDARAGTANTSAGVHLTLAWDAKSGEVAGDDPLILAAIRTLAIWLREDDGEILRMEANGLADMFIELYRSSAAPEKLDFRRPILVAFEGLTAEEDGVEALLSNGGWEALTDDFLSILQSCSSPATSNTADASRGIEIVRILLPIAEAEQPGTRDAWMDIVTKAAACYVPDTVQPPVVVELQVAALQFVTTLLANTHPGMQKRYVHSTGAILGIASQLRSRAKGDAALEEALEDVVETLTALR